MDLAIDHIRSFLAVIDYGGYHRAADALHLSQPAVSKHVRRLEDQLGTQLFDRRGRGVEVSARGEEVATELRAVLGAHDRAVAHVTRETAGGRPFLLGAIEHLVDPVLPELLAVAREQQDGVEISLRVDRSRALVERVEAGTLDAAIVMHTWGAADALELGSVPLHWWAGADMAARPLPDPLPIVAYDPPCGLREMTLAALDDGGHERTLAAESPHLSGIHSAVRGGMGVALLAGGADGLRRVADARLPTGLSAPLWLVAAEPHRTLAEPLRRALWAAITRADRGRAATAGPRVS